MDKILITVVTIAIVVFGGLLIEYLRKNLKEVSASTENIKLKEAIEVLDNLIVKAVGAINQTYVNDLKTADKFGKAEMKEAFTKSAKAIEKLLDEESKSILEKKYTDIESYVKLAIENEVRKQK